MTELVEPLQYCPFDFAQGKRGSDALKDWLDVSRLCSRPSDNSYREESAERDFPFASEEDGSSTLARRPECMERSLLERR